MASDSTSAPVLVVAVWFGSLPAWFQLWLDSCRHNPTIDWLLVTDDDVSPYQVPENVHVVGMTLSELAERLGRFADVDLTPGTPYKVCDYRPLFSCLTELVPGQWDFWGHCDIDLIFGDVDKFLTQELLRDHDRIFGQGHFSIYRNDHDTNNYFRLPHPSLDYRAILADPEHRGFDEHAGVNRIWERHHGRFYEDEAVVADLDPHSPSLRMTTTRGHVSNHRPQASGFEGGRVFRVYLKRRRPKSDEFMYVHFQKRSLPVLGDPGTSTGTAWLTPEGFVAMESHVDVDRKLLLRLNPEPLIPGPREIARRARHRARLLRRRLSGTIHD